MIAKEILIAARAKIDTPSKLAKGWFATDVNGVRVSSSSPNAVCFCSLGAVYSCDEAPEGSLYHTPETMKAVSLLEAALGSWKIPYFNDNSTHAEVLELFDKAIALATD